MLDVLARTDWRRRSPDLNTLQLLERASTGERLVTIGTGIDGASELGQTWGLLDDASVMQPFVGLDGRVLLRYAAIDWLDRPWRFRFAVVASRGAELARIFGSIAGAVPEAERGWLACPLAFVDLDHQVRVAFAQPDKSEAHARRIPPEVIDHWPRCDERGLVFVIGQLLANMLGDGAEHEGTPFGAALKRSLSRSPDERFASLDELRAAMLIAAGGRDRPPSTTSADAFAMLETGLGLYHFGRPALALPHLLAAAVRDPSSLLASEALREVERRSDVLTRRRAWVWQPLEPTARLRRWDEATAEAVRDREVARDFRGALDLLHSLRADEVARDDVRLAIARCCLAIGELGMAIDYARRAVTSGHGVPEAHALHATALSRAKQHAEALLATESWLKAAPGTGEAYYVRGKAQLALGKLPEARASLDRACALAPRHLAAMVLRTSVLRRAKRLQDDVGIDLRKGLPVPDHLGEVEPVLAAGRIQEAIAMLRDATDLDALRLLASCHEYRGDYASALAVFERLDDRLGRARALIALDRADEALALLDGEEPDVIDARADALERLGRRAEAEGVRRRISWER